MSGVWPKLPGSMRQMIWNVTNNGRTLTIFVGTNTWAKISRRFATTPISEFTNPLPLSLPNHPTFRRHTRWTWNVTRAWSVVRWWPCRKIEYFQALKSCLSLVSNLQPILSLWRHLIRASTTLALSQALQFLSLPWQSHSMPLKSARKIRAALMITLSLSFESFQYRKILNKLTGIIIKSKF